MSFDRRSIVQGVAAAAAGAALSWWAFGRPTVPAAPPTTPTPAVASSATPAGQQFMLLILDPPSTGAPPTAEQIKEIVGAHRAWAERLRGENRLVMAEKLADDGGRFVPASASASSPVAANGWRVGGFYIIRAADYDEAVRIAESGPGTIGGGRVEVRQIEGT